MLLPANCRDSNTSTLVQKQFNMKIAKKKVRMQTTLVNPIIDLERPLEKILEKVLKKGEYIVIKYHHTPGDNDSGSYEIDLPYCKGGLPEEWFVWRFKLRKVSDG